MLRACCCHAQPAASIRGVVPEGGDGRQPLGRRFMQDPRHGGGWVGARCGRRRLQVLGPHRQAHHRRVFVCEVRPTALARALAECCRAAAAAGVAGAGTSPPPLLPAAAACRGGRTLVPLVALGDSLPASRTMACTVGASLDASMASMRWRRRSSLSPGGPIRLKSLAAWAMEQGEDCHQYPKGGSGRIQKLGKAAVFSQGQNQRVGGGVV
jgi:hypothetical protein